MERSSTTPTSSDEDAAIGARAGFDTGRPVANTGVPARAEPGVAQTVNAPAPAPASKAVVAPSARPPTEKEKGPTIPRVISSAMAIPLPTGVERSGKAEAGCADVGPQLKRDQEALRRQRQANESGLRELAGWEDENEKAQQAAVTVAKHALIDGTIDHFIDRFGERAKELQEQLDKKPIRRADRWFVHDLAGRINEINRLKNASEMLKIAHGSWQSFELWNELHELHERAHVTAVDVGGFVRKLAENRFVDEAAKKALLAAANDFERKIIEANFPPATDAIKLGNFLVDYGYEAWRWTASRNRILEQNRLTEEELKAVTALSCQVERTVTRLNECQGTKPPALSRRCVIASRHPPSPSP
jgi:hypothetical protein